MRIPQIIINPCICQNRSKLPKNSEWRETGLSGAEEDILREAEVRPGVKEQWEEVRCALSVFQCVSVCFSVVSVFIIAMPRRNCLPKCTFITYLHKFKNLSFNLALTFLLCS
jgi:hypothetical protein